MSLSFVRDPDCHFPLVVLVYLVVYTLNLRESLMTDLKATKALLLSKILVSVIKLVWIHFHDYWQTGYCGSCKYYGCNSISVNSSIWFQLSYLLTPISYFLSHQNRFVPTLH